MSYYILFYHLNDNYLEERGQYRAEHLDLAKNASARGDLVLGGALEEPADKAVLIFTEKEQAVAFAEKDPYLKNGLIKNWNVRKWNAVIGSKLD